MYHYQQFCKSDRIQEVKISLILAIASHIKFAKNEFDFQFDENVLRS